MDFLKILLLVGIVAVVVGCKKNEDEPVKPVDTPAAQNVRIALEEIAENGQINSGMMLLREEMEKHDASLLPELDAMAKMTNPDQIKAAAKALLAKVGSG